MPVAPMKVRDARREQLMVFIAEITRTPAPARDLHALIGRARLGAIARSSSLAELNAAQQNNAF